MASTVPSPARREILRSAVDEYARHAHLATEYLESRGFDTGIAHRWKLGVCVDPVVGHEHMRGRLIVPYLTPAGPVAVVGRCIQRHDCRELGHGKYTYERGVRRGLFGVFSLHQPSEVIVISEGELDTIAVCALAGIPAVGVGGAQAWQRHMRFLFDGYRDVVVVSDGDREQLDEDGANRSPAGRLADRIVHDVRQARVVAMPFGLDANSFIVDRGVGAFRKAVLG